MLSQNKLLQLSVFLHTNLQLSKRPEMLNTAVTAVMAVSNLTYKCTATSYLHTAVTTLIVILLFQP